MVEDIDDSSGWTRARVVFLGISGALTLILLVLVREVLLPFLLAVVIAYVLTPLVASCEARLRFPRPAAIAAVYAVVLGVCGLFVSALAPVLFRESVRLVRDAPRLVQSAVDTYGPELDRRVNAYLGQRVSDSKKPVEAGAPRPPALSIQEEKDGVYAVHVVRGFEIAPDGNGHFHVVDADSLPAGQFRMSALLSEGLGRALSYVETNVGGMLRLGQVIIGGFTRSIFVLFMVLMVAAYLMYTRESVLSFFRSLVPGAYRGGFDRLLLRMDKGLSGVVRGQLLICLVNGVLSAIGFWLFGLKYWQLLALFATLLSIIPIFGAILSTVPAVLVGLTQSLGTAMWVLIWVVLIHQLEANLLNPKIIGVAAKIHPVLIVFALLVGEHFFGLWGALLAVPTLSILQSIFNHFRFGLSDAPPDSLILVARRPTGD